MATGPYYSYVSAVMAGMWCLPFTVFFVLSFFLARRKGDPARVAVVWLKILLPFAILSVHPLSVAKRGFSRWFYPAYLLTSEVSTCADAPYFTSSVSQLLSSCGRAVIITVPG